MFARVAMSDVDDGATPWTPVHVDQLNPRPVIRARRLPRSPGLAPFERRSALVVPPPPPRLPPLKLRSACPRRACLLISVPRPWFTCAALWDVLRRCRAVLGRAAAGAARAGSLCSPLYSAARAAFRLASECRSAATRNRTSQTLPTRRRLGFGPVRAAGLWQLSELVISDAATDASRLRHAEFTTARTDPDATPGAAGRFCTLGPMADVGRSEQRPRVRLPAHTASGTVRSSEPPA